jgi:hypothetical protein
MGGCFSSDEGLFAYFFDQKKVRENPLFRKAKQNHYKQQQNYSKDTCYNLMHTFVSRDFETNYAAKNLHIFRTWCRPSRIS